MVAGERLSTGPGRPVGASVRHRQRRRRPGPALIPARGGAPSHRRPQAPLPFRASRASLRREARRRPTPVRCRLHALLGSCCPPAIPAPHRLPTTCELHCPPVPALREATRGGGDLEGRGAGKGRPGLGPGEGAGQGLGASPALRTHHLAGPGSRRPPDAQWAWGIHFLNENYF